MYDDPWSSFDFDNVSANLPSVTPPPLESFEEMLNALEREHLDVHVNVQFPTMTQPLPDISFPTVASTQSQSTYSVPGLTDTGNTEYSFMSTSSNYPPPSNPVRSDVVLSFEYNNVLDKVGPKHSPAISQSTTPMFPSFQHDHVFNGTDRQLVGISPHCLSVAIASPPPAIPSDPSASIASTTRVFTGPIRTKRTKKPKEPTCNQCDQCGRGKYNLYDFY